MKIDNKHNILGIGVNSVDYPMVCGAVINAAIDKKPFKVTALAVHGVMTGYLDPDQQYRLNGFDCVTPDGQPVRWALNLLHGCNLADRVYGPDLMLKICSKAAKKKLPIFLYGSRDEVLQSLSLGLQEQIPDLQIAGTRPSLFRLSTEQEKQAIVEEIRNSGAAIVFVGLGCPRQEVFVHEYAELLGMPTLAVGAAFDFHAGLLGQAPPWMQDRGLEWLYRFGQEPRRLWRRYLFLNPAYLTLIALQFLGLRRFQGIGTDPKKEIGHA